MKSSSVLELIRLYETYGQETGQEDFIGFSVWLHTQQSTGADPEPKSRPLVKSGIDTLDQLLRLQKIARLYWKEFQSDEETIGPEGFFLLRQLQKEGSMPKSKLYRLCMMDVPGGSQWMRRLEQQGWVSDGKKNPDQRVRTVRITPKGKKKLEAWESQIARWSKWLWTPLEETARKNWVEGLQILTLQHQKVRENNDTRDFDWLKKRYPEKGGWK